MVTVLQVWGPVLGTVDEHFLWTVDLHQCQKLNRPVAKYISIGAVSRQCTVLRVSTYNWDNVIFLALVSLGIQKQSDQYSSLRKVSYALVCFGNCSPGSCVLGAWGLSSLGNLFSSGSHMPFACLSFLGTLFLSGIHIPFAWFSFPGTLFLSGNVSCLLGLVSQELCFCQIIVSC